MTEAYWARYESVIDRQIRMAQERGDFDDLPGKGKPLAALNGPDDETWWVRRFVEREGLPTESLLPTPLQLRKEIERLPDTVRGLPTEQAVRAIASELNKRVVEWLRAPSGPAVPLRPVNLDAVVERWRADRSPPARPAAPASTPPRASAAPEQTLPRTPWWRRLTRRN